MVSKIPSQPSLVVLIVLIVFLGVQFSHNAHEQLTWDESVYVGIAKFIASGGQSGLYESIRPLALPVLMVPWLLLGLDAVVVGKILALSASGLCLLALYLIASNESHHQQGLLAATLLAFTPVFFFSAQDIMTEIPSLAALLFAVYFSIRKSYVISGLFAGLAAAVKFPHLLGLLILLVCIPSWRHKIRASAAALIPLVLNGLANYLLTGSAIDPVLWASRHGQNIAFHQEGIIANLTYYLIESLKDNPLLIIGLVGLILLWKSTKKISPGLQFLFLQAGTYLIYFTWIPNKQLRFFILFAPLFCILAARGIGEVVHRLKCPQSISVMVVLAVGMGMIYFSQLSYAEADDSREHIIDALATMQSPVLTTDPIIAAYTPHRFIPFYFFIYDEENATVVFNEYNSKSNAVIWWPQAFACEKYPGMGCEEMLADIEQELTRSWKLALATNVNGGPYRIYTRTTSVS